MADTSTKPKPCQITRIVAWNANGLLKRKSELESLLKAEDVDIALIAETHLTSHNKAEIRDYRLFTCNHPSGSAHGGTAIYIKKGLQHHEAKAHCTEAIQAAVITARLHCGTDVHIAAIYCPPKHQINADEYEEFFTQLGNKWIAGGDYNAKHHLWGSRIITKKGKELYSCVNKMNIQCYSNGLPTYWPTDNTKKPDCIDFFLSRGISDRYLEVENLNDLSSDHSPLVLTLSNSILRQTSKMQLTTRLTDWDKFREVIDSHIDLRIKLKTIDEIDGAVQHLQSIIVEAAQAATPNKKSKPAGTFYPTEVKKLIKARRAARHRWQSTRDPADKSRFNSLCKQTKELIAKINDETFGKFMCSLGPTKETNYSLWKVAKVRKKPPSYTPAIRRSNGLYARSDTEKAEAFATHLEKVFQPNNLNSDINPQINGVEGPALKFIEPKEIRAVVKKMKIKKAPGLDLITTQLMLECPRRAVVYLANIYNACLRLSYFPKQWKTAKIIMIPKPGKPLDDPASFRPISLLTILSKIFEKLIYKRIATTIDKLNIIPDHQFGFRAAHSTLEQVHRVATTVRNSLEAKKFCPAIFLDVKQAFDRVWLQGLLHKVSEYLPKNHVQLLASYLLNRKFVVHHGEATSDDKSATAGVPQGSVLGPLLYLLYTADIPSTKNTTIATFADDAAILAPHEKYETAVNQLQKAVDKVSKWANRWKIQMNATKSVRVDFALRPHPVAPIVINNEEIPTQPHARYLGVHLDSRLTWKVHIAKKKEEIKAILRSMYWLFRKGNKLSLENKRLLYISILRPIWSYAAPIWGSAADSNLLVLQRLQNHIIRKMTGALWYIRNDCLHSDLNLPTVKEVIEKLAASYEKRIHKHRNNLALQLLEFPPIRRLKRKLTTDIII